MKKHQLQPWAELLVAHREAKAWTQADVVDVLAHAGVIVSRSAVAMWERATNGPSRENALALARLFSDTRLVSMIYPINVDPQAPATQEQMATLARIVRSALGLHVTYDERVKVINALDELLVDLGAGVDEDEGVNGD